MASATAPHSVMSKGASLDLWSCEGTTSSGSGGNPVPSDETSSCYRSLELSVEKEDEQTHGSNNKVMCCKVLLSGNYLNQFILLNMTVILLSTMPFRLSFTPFINAGIFMESTWCGFKLNSSFLEPDEEDCAKGPGEIGF